VPHIDLQSVSSAAIGWLVEQILSFAVLEALGITAAVTLITRKFTSKVSSMRDTVAFDGLLFAAFLIAINSFGARDLKPNIVVKLIQAAAGSGSEGQHGAIVYIVAQMTNRGNVQTATVGYTLSADINGNAVDGIPAPIGSPVAMKFGDKSFTISPSEQFLGYDVILPVGIPLTRFGIFSFPQIPISSFGGPITYKLTVTDSFGRESTGTLITHGEFMEMPGIPAPPSTPAVLGPQPH
jgi:hypothetical protein